MTTNPTAYIEVLARLLCAADVHVHGDEHPTWQQLSTGPGRGVQDDYRKAAAWLQPRLTVNAETRLSRAERRCDELRAESKRRGKTVLEYSEKIRALEREVDGLQKQLGAEILRAGQAEGVAPGPPATRAADRDRIAEIEELRKEHATWRKLGHRNLELAHEENARLRAEQAATLEHIHKVVRRLAAHAVGFQDVLDDTDRGPWGATVGADIAELRRMADEAQQPETEAHADPKCVCGHPVRLHHEDVCLTADCDCADCLEPEGPLPDRLEAVLTRRFTELGNPFSRMSINFQGPDGWPASKEVGPHDVAEVLRELLADEAGGARRAADDEQPAEAQPADDGWCGATEIVPDREVQRLAATGLVGYQQDRGRLLHCLMHKPAPASRYVDFRQVTSDDLPDGGICVHPSCGADLLAVQPAAEASREVVHGCPPDGSGLTPCCGRTPFELPLGDRISSEAPVTCQGAP